MGPIHVAGSVTDPANVKTVGWHANKLAVSRRKRAVTPARRAVMPLLLARKTRHVRIRSSLRVNVSISSRK